MMALFDKFIRKWLFGLAVAVRNRAQAVIAGMESGEEKNGQDANRQAAPGAARPVRAGGPPAHWVRLVKRHAPELLHPGPPYAFPRESALAPEREGRREESSAADIQEPPSAGGVLKADDARTQAVPQLSLNLPRLLKAHDVPHSRRMKPGNEKQTGSFDEPPAAEAMPAKTKRRDAPPAALRTTQAGSVDNKHLQFSSADAAQSPSKRLPGPDRNHMPAHSRPPVFGSRGAGAGAARTPAARRYPPADGPAEKSRSAAKKRKNIREDAGEKYPPYRLTGGRDLQLERQAVGRQGDFRIDTKMPVQGFARPEAAYESGPRPREDADELRSAPQLESAPSAAQVKWPGDDFGQAPRIGLADEHPNAQPSADGPKTEAIRIRASEFRWPDLPGEKNNDAAAEASQLNPAWPDLPEDQSAGAGAYGQQIKPYPAEDESRSIERLRRLDAEQKGISWSASRF